MGNKKSQHQTQSFGNMVSKAALSQMLPQIQQMVNQLGSRIAMQQASVIEGIFTRIVVLEKILIDNKITTQDALTNKYADVEDERDNLETVGDLKSGDTARLELKSKQQSDKEYPNETAKLKVINIGTGNTLGKDVEQELLGMKTGETKVVKAGQKKDIDVSITLSRSSRSNKVQEVPKQEAQDGNNQVQG